MHLYEQPRSCSKAAVVPTGCRSDEQALPFHSIFAAAVDQRELGEIGEGTLVAIRGGALDDTGKRLALLYMSDCPHPVFAVLLRHVSRHTRPAKGTTMGTLNWWL